MGYVLACESSNKLTSGHDIVHYKAIGLCTLGPKYMHKQEIGTSRIPGARAMRLKLFDIEEDSSRVT